MKTQKEINLLQYSKEKKTADIAKANLFGVLLCIPVGVLYGVPYYFVWRNEPAVPIFEEFFDASAFIYVVVLLAGIVLHELIHGCCWALFVKNGFKSIQFGVLWKMLTPYCHCKEPLPLMPYVFGLIMPAVVLGFVPAIVSVCIGSRGLLILGGLFTVAAAGDFLIFNLLRRESRACWVEDHPSEVGCYVYRPLK
ncbi:MAG: DUF3267 domain-containing protein [Bacteroidales bacterium]|jgi:hypothetical protein|nr:DUF3267 domain-containing protein [Bacteroidales bacterium]